MAESGDASDMAVYSDGRSTFYGNDPTFEMPTQDESQEQLNESTIIKNEDPSQYYEIINKIAVGGFAKVFKVRRKSDGHICALKYTEPKNENERKMLINEIGLMQICQDDSEIIQCLEAFDFKKRLWIFLEYLDGGALTNFVEDMEGNISE